MASSLLFSILAAILIIFVTVIKWLQTYWSRRNFQHLSPDFLFGNIKAALQGKEHISVGIRTNYDLMKQRGWKYGGMYFFTTPVYLPIDLDLLKNVLTKDFKYFHDRQRYYNENDKLEAHLMNVRGKTWRNLRIKLTPAFTSSKMKLMFNIMSECVTDLTKRMDRECAKNEPIEIKKILACFTTNIIGSCAFGIEIKALEQEVCEFREIGKKIFAITPWLNFKTNFSRSFQKIAKFLRVSLSQEDVVDFIMKMVQETIDYREKNNFVRNDFLQMMMNLKKTDDEHCWTLDEIASQCMVFFAAGFETSATLMTFVLYELAKHQEIQKKLREEILSVLAKNNNQLTYELLQEMLYLNKVVDETLRLHPPAPAVTRRCKKDYLLENENVMIERGTMVAIPIVAIHHDSEYYREPLKFDPERFSEENRKSRHPYAYIPFGEGPRSCIGMRFGLMESKVGLVGLFKNYKFSINRKTKEPIFYQPTSLPLAVDGEVWLDVEKI